MTQTRIAAIILWIEELATVLLLIAAPLIISFLGGAKMRLWVSGLLLFLGAQQQMTAPKVEHKEIQIL